MIEFELPRRTQRRKGRVLPLSFYKRDTVQVARELLGKQIVHKVNGQRLAGLIVETEAYKGVDDAACHAFGARRTPRNKSLYLEGGHAYIYFIYGMYFCLNVVTQKTNCPEAVLIRGLQPTEGIEEMLRLRQRKTKIRQLRDVSNGPGKLCLALDLDRRHDGLLLNGPKLFIEDVNVKVPPGEIVSTTRVGVDYAGEAAHWPLRFYIRGNSFVSRF